MKNVERSSFSHQWISSLKYASCRIIPPVLLYCFSLIYFLLGVQIYQTIEWKSATNFSSTSLFIGAMLSTMGERTAMPQTKFGKLFLLFYLLFGIPLTFVLIRQFSEVLKRILQSFLRSTDSTDFSISQMLVFLLVYLVVGASLFSANSFVDRIYFSFTSFFTIEFHLDSFQKSNCSVYLLFAFVFVGLSLLIFWCQTIENQIEQVLFLVARRSVLNFFEAVPQIGETLMDEPNVDEMIRSSIKSTDRPICLSEPFRRLSNNLIRTFKTTKTIDRQTSEKTVQVNTTIRSCSRCNESAQSFCSNGRPLIISTGDDDEDDEFDDDDALPPPNLDQTRQRRATLVAKTILDQMARQPRSGSMEDLLPMVSLAEANSSYQRSRSADSTPMKFKCSIKVSPPAQSPSSEKHQDEFLEITKQISSLLVPSDEEF